MFNALVVDDDPGNRTYLKTLLQQRAKDVQVVGEAGNIADARTLLMDRPVDVVFLDVEMPGGTGFELLRDLGHWSFEVIFTTAFHHYAVQAIRFSALDYLLKPVQPDELDMAIERFRGRRAQGPARADIQAQFINNIAQRDEKDLKLTLSSGDRAYFISPAEVTFCNADGNYTEVHLTDGRRFLCARTLKEYEDMLKPWQFLRVHRSSLVNRKAITQVREHVIVMSGGQQIEISRRKREEVKRALSL